MTKTTYGSGTAMCKKEGHYKWWERLLQNYENRNMNTRGVQKVGSLLYRVANKKWNTHASRRSSNRAASKAIRVHHCSEGWSPWTLEPCV